MIRYLYMTAVGIIVVIFVIGLLMDALGDGWVGFVGVALMLYAGIWFGHNTGLLDGVLLDPGFTLPLG